MRSILLASPLLLAPALAAGAPQCVIPAATAAPPALEAQPPVAAALPPPATAAAAPKLIPTDQVDRVPALRRIASNGAQLFDLGTEHGLRTVFARNGSLFQVFYLTADGQAAVGGVMWTADGQNVTKRQIAPIEGTIPTVTIGTPGAQPPAPPAPVRAAARPAGSLLKAVEGTTFGTVGPASAPRLYVFIDPLCSFSVRAMEALRPYVASGRVQLAVIPLSVLDYEDGGRSTVAAKAMLSLPPDAIVAAWGSNKLDGPASEEAASRLAANMLAAEAVSLRGTPTFVWRKRDGSEGRADGIPGDLDALIASMGN